MANSNSSCSSSSSGRRKRSRELAAASAAISIPDVYDMAADIGREFESLIDSHGAEHVTALMQKVISALEHLEALSGERDAERSTIDSLQTQVKHLELEDSKKMEERQRNAKELEQVEEHYKQETRDLLSTIKKLQDENRKLASSLAAATERDSAFSEDESYFEVGLVNKLETVIEKQRNQIKKLDRSVLDYQTENDELSCQNEKLSACTRDLRRKLRSTQTQLHSMVDERADLTAKTQDQQREIHQLTKQLGLAAKECQDLSQSSASLLSRVQAGNPKPTSDSASSSSSNSSPSPQPPKKQGQDGKHCTDDDEAEVNRPRFSLPELRNILEERNSLKARVSDLEDELNVYKPHRKNQISFTSAATDVTSPSRVRLSAAAAGAVTDCDCAFHSGGGDDEPLDSEDELDDAIECDEALESDCHREGDGEDLPVQGPLPQDPEDAPFLKNESGIRKLFRRVFGGVGGLRFTGVDHGVYNNHISFDYDHRRQRAMYSPPAAQSSTSISRGQSSSGVISRFSSMIKNTQPSLSSTSQVSTCHTNPTSLH